MFFKDGDEVSVEFDKSVGEKSTNAKIIKTIGETHQYEIEYKKKGETEKNIIKQSELLHAKVLEENYNLLYKNNPEEISAILSNLKKPDISPISKRSKTTKDGRKKSSRKKMSNRKSKKKSRRKSNK